MNVSLNTFSRSIWMAAILILMASLIFLLSSFVEAERRSSNPQTDIVIAITDTPPLSEMVKIGVAPLFTKEEQVSSLLQFWGESAIPHFSLRWQYTVISAPVDKMDWDALLDEGRPPQPGKNEAVSGAFCHLSLFDFEGKHYQVVGKLKRSVGALVFSYVVPQEDLSEDHGNWVTAWLDLSGSSNLHKDESTQEPLEDAPHPPVFLGGDFPLDKDLATWNLSALLLAACGATIFWCALFAADNGAQGAHFSKSCSVFKDYRFFFVSMHFILYGIFFAFLIAGEQFPLLRRQLIDLTSDMFREGNLQFIGDAYKSGDILRASFATWAWNFGAATLTLTILPSLIIPLWGFAKTLLSFALVGFLMAPTWSDTALHMSYHCITMTVEFEAYIVACFATMLFPWKIFKGFLAGTLVKNLKEGLEILTRTTFLAAIILAVAAIYEAGTIILFGKISP